MKLSTRGRYGTQAAVVLALNYGRGPVSLKDIARREDIPERYLENIMAKLTARGLVRSLRGQNGGFILSRAPEEVRLTEILYALEGSITPVECIDNAGFCRKKMRCATHDVWMQLKKAVQEKLDSFTLFDLVKLQQSKSAEDLSTMYYI